MKTLNDLKDLILKQENKKFKIGTIEISCNDEEQDIDLKIDGRLIAWIDEEDTTKELSDLYVNLASSITKDISEETTSLRSKNKVLEKRLSEAKEQYDINQKALGKVEAYENILLGREINVSK